MNKRQGTEKELKTEKWKEYRDPKRGRGFVLTSLDGGRGALVDACATVDALSGIDDSDVIAGDCALGADIDACSACDTLGLFNGYHYDNLAQPTSMRYIIILKNRSIPLSSIGFHLIPTCIRPTSEPMDATINHPVR